jgi:hypothetical protein
VRSGVGGGGVGEDGPGYVLEDAAVEEGGEGSVEEDGEGAGGLFEEEAVGEDSGVPPPRAMTVLRWPRRRRGRSIRGGGSGARRGGRRSRDGEAGAGLEVGVEVEEVPAESGGEEAADGALAGPHEAGEDDAAQGGGELDLGGVFFGH